MSMILSDSGDIDCGCNSGACGRGFFKDGIRIGDYYVNKDDFAALVMYFMTNTDLEDDDIRLSLKERISNLYKGVGYNSGNIRLVEE